MAKPTQRKVKELPNGVLARAHTIFHEITHIEISLGISLALRRILEDFNNSPSKKR